MRDDHLDYLRELFSDFAPVSVRAMFGGHGVYRDGVILALVIDEAPYLKTDARSRPAFKAAGCVPFSYEARGKAIATSYWSVPAEALDSPQDFLPWARLAWEAALRKPKPGPRKRSASFDPAAGGSAPSPPPDCALSPR